jgi:hypothetical protein
MFISYIFFPAHGGQVVIVASTGEAPVQAVQQNLIGIEPAKNSGLGLHSSR